MSYNNLKQSHLEKVAEMQSEIEQLKTEIVKRDAVIDFLKAGRDSGRLAETKINEYKSIAPR
jgi:hypothetical protein